MMASFLSFDHKGDPVSHKHQHQEVNAEWIIFICTQLVVTFKAQAFRAYAFKYKEKTYWTA